ALNRLSGGPVMLLPKGGSHDGRVAEDLEVPLVQPALDREERGLRAPAARGDDGALRVGGVRARGHLARLPRLDEAVPLRQPAGIEAGAGDGCARTARPADRRG